MAGTECTCVGPGTFRLPVFFRDPIEGVTDIRGAESTMLNATLLGIGWVFGVRNNFNDTIGSDHAPHLKENKDKEYPNTPSGMPGVQTIFPVMLDHVNNGKLSLQQLINLMCENPCKIFGIKNKGYIKEGFDADLTIADMNKEVTIKNEMIASKCGWTPFNNYKVKGFPVGTIVNGHLVMSDGKVIEESKGTPLKF